MDWIAKQLTVLAEAFGEPMTPQRLKIYAQNLADIDQGRLAAAFGRAIRELTWFPKIAQLRDLAGASPKESQDAETRKAWDVVIDFAAKYVQCDPHGRYVIDQGCRVSPPPQLSDQLLDSVRRAGDWGAFKCMTKSDHPFQQKRFFEEYRAWTAVEQIELPRLITTEMPRLQLVAKPMDPPKIASSEPEPVKVPAKRIPAALGEKELRDRREMLQQQVALIAQRRAGQQVSSRLQ